MTRIWDMKWTKNRKEIETFLNDGWEPFFVQDDGIEFVYFFKRRTTQIEQTGV